MVFDRFCQMLGRNRKSGWRVILFFFLYMFSLCPFPLIQIASGPSAGSCRSSGFSLRSSSLLGSDYQGRTERRNADLPLTSPLTDNHRSCPAFFFFCQRALPDFPRDLGRPPTASCSETDVVCASCGTCHAESHPAEPLRPTHTTGLRQV